MTSEQESIPVLTQIYVGSEPPVLSPAFFEFAMAQLKPFLDKAITEAAIENQKETIKNEILDELRGHAAPHLVWRYILGNQRASRDDGALADRDAGRDRDAGGNPRVFADADRPV